MVATLSRDYPWILTPLVACAPMRLIALASLTSEVSKAGGIGFVGAGSDADGLEEIIKDVATRCKELTSRDGCLPVGVGFLLWAGDKLLQEILPILQRYKPAAVWLFAPREPSEYTKWSSEIRRVTCNVTKIWVQVGTVGDAVSVVRLCQPDVLVVQGSDAGGHGLQHCAGLVTLLPEVNDTISTFCTEFGLTKPTLVAAGGIVDGRGTAAAFALGAEGVVMGTRYLAAQEANIAAGYRDAVLAAGDGGVNTQRGKLYDTLRGTTDWPKEYGGRGVLNCSFYDDSNGLTFEENKRLYDAAVEQGDAGWGANGRLTTYAGTGVGLVKKTMSAAEITKEIRADARANLAKPYTFF